MRLIFRNFVNVLKCYKQSSIFNILGLSFAFVACYLIFIQTSYEFNFGKVHKDYENIYRANVQIGDMKAALGTPIVKEALDKSGGVLASSLLNMFNNSGVFAELDGEKLAVDIEIIRVDSNMNKVLEFDMVAGDFISITNPNAIIIPLSMAKNTFGSAENAIGKKVFCDQVSDNALDITAVYRDFSESAVLTNLIYTHLNIDYSKEFNGFSDVMYIKLVDGVNIENLEKEITELSIKRLQEKIMNQPISITFSPLTDIYFEKDIQFSTTPTGNKAISFTLVFVALLIMIIAIINFVNFSIALAPRRIKAINTYRVLGHSLVGLRFMLIFEAVFTSIVSLLLSVGFIQLISDTNFVNIFSSSIMVVDNIDTLIIMGGFAIIVGIIAGIYPAFHITNFSPALVLNGGKSLPKSALLIRQILISFQYVISISMIIISIFINLQNNYMMNKDYGYDTENFLEVYISSNSQRIKSELLENYSFIKDIAFSQNSIILGTSYMLQGTDDANSTMYDELRVDYNYPKVIGLEIIEGEDFVESDMKNSKYALFNETAKKAMGLEIGQKIMPQNIIVKGIFKDINHKSLHSAITPLAISVSKWANDVMCIKYVGDENIGNVIEAVRKVTAELNNGEIAHISTVDQTRHATYKKDANLNMIISWAAMLAILISIVGVVGLISLESQHRIREIALRKVHGATTGEILKMFNVKFVKIVAICYVISVPLAWVVVNSWLQGFEYKVPMSAWVFIVAGVFIAGLTIFIVTAQSYRAATTNPARAMKS